MRFKMGKIKNAKMLRMCAISENILNRCFIFIHIIRDGVNFWFYF